MTNIKRRMQQEKDLKGNFNQQRRLWKGEGKMQNNIATKGKMKPASKLKREESVTVLGIEHLGRQNLKSNVMTV